MSEHRDITSMAGLMDGIAAGRNWRRILNRHRVFEFWGEAVGKDVSAHARPSIIRGKVLHVEVTDSVWMQQLHLQKNHVLVAVNRRLGDDGLDDIRFVLKSCGSFAADKPEVPKRKQPEPSRLAAFERLLAAVDDEGIKSSMKRIWLAQEGRG